MSPTPRIWTSPTRVDHCWDWITAEDICRHALASIAIVKKALVQPPGRRFAEPDGTSWSTRECFADNLVQVFEMRVKTEGYHLGVNKDWVEEARLLQKWLAPRIWFPDERLHPEQQGLQSKASTTFGGGTAKSTT